MAIKKKTVKSKKSVATKKTAMKKTSAKKAAVKKTGRGRSKVAVKKSPVKKATMKKATMKKAAVKKTVTKKPAAKKKAARAANPAAERIKALRAELAEVKAELKATKKREAGLSKIAGNMSSAIEKSVSKMMKTALTGLEKSLKFKPRKKKAKAVKADDSK